MINKIIYTFFCFPISANAAYQNFMWVLTTPPAVFANNIVLTDYTNTGTSVISANSALLPGRVVASSCSGFHTSNRIVDGSKTNWLLMPTTANYNGVKLTISPPRNNGWRAHTNNAPVPAGYSASINSKESKFIWGQSSCFPIGTLHPHVDFQWQDASINILVDRGTAIPGQYNFNVPFYFGYEEVKTNNNTSGAVASSAPQLVYAQGTQMNIPVSLTINSLCSYTTEAINLSHGAINLRSGVTSYPTSDYALNITCSAVNPGVSIKLTGSHPVPGMSANYTQCGSGGRCELLFDVANFTNQYDKTLSIAGTQTIKIRSVYHPTNEVVAGHFNGSGILTILVN